MERYRLKKTYLFLEIPSVTSSEMRPMLSGLMDDRSPDWLPSLSIKAGTWASSLPLESRGTSSRQLTSSFRASSRRLLGVSVLLNGGSARSPAFLHGWHGGCSISEMSQAGIRSCRYWRTGSAFLLHIAAVRG